MPFEKDPNEIGALWLKRSVVGGKEYMTGEINGEKIVCFRGKGDVGTKVPAWKVLKSVPKEGGASRPMHNANATQLDDF